LIQRDDISANQDNGFAHFTLKKEFAGEKHGKNKILKQT
jgi:hypothetical protein